MKNFHFHMCTLLLSLAFIATTIVKGIDESDWQSICPDEWSVLTDCFNETSPSVADDCLSCISSATEPGISTEATTCYGVSQFVCDNVQVLCKSECGSCHNDMVDTYLCHFNEILQSSNSSEFSVCNPVLACGPDTATDGGNSAALSGHLTLLQAAFLAPALLVAIF